MKYLLLAILIAIGSIVNSSPKTPKQVLQVVVVEGDEMPGIGADTRKPDTCLAYYNKIDKHVHILYLTPRPPKMIR